MPCDLFSSLNRSSAFLRRFQGGEQRTHDVEAPCWHFVRVTWQRDVFVAGGTWPELLDAMRLRPLLCYLLLAACYEDPGDLYDILEISPLANPQEVKKAYRTLSLRHHPGGLPS